MDATGPPGRYGARLGRRPTGRPGGPIRLKPAREAPTRRANPCLADRPVTSAMSEIS